MSVKAPRYKHRALQLRTVGSTHSTSHTGPAGRSEQQFSSRHFADATSFRPRRWPVPLRRRRESADRLLPRHGPHDPRPPAGRPWSRRCAPSSNAASSSAARARSSSRPRNWCAACCPRLRRSASPRPAARPSRRPSGLPGPQRPRDHHQVRRPLSRLARQRPLERRAGTGCDGCRRRAGAAPGTPGQDALAGERVEVLSWNRPDFFEERLSRGDVAGVIMEPAMCNAGAISPVPGLPRNRARGLHGGPVRADLRRGHHRLPRRAGRRAGEARRDA